LLHFAHLLSCSVHNHPLFIFLFFNLILITKLFTPTEKGKGGEGFKNNCEKYPFEDYSLKSGMSI